MSGAALEMPPSEASQWVEARQAGSALRMPSGNTYNYIYIHDLPTIYR